ncbi:MAG: methyltransferase domain-containing protein [Lachnospiraceae bacterium]|jgi:SAM-dependent methyltransferase|nr:methyltransferase domain-containing protein [Lachnospiraceae bacterium]
MQNQDIREYFSRIGIRKITRLDTALLETFGQEEGGRHIERLDELFGRSEERLFYGTGNTVYLHRQKELVAYLNQSLQMSLLAASFYDRVFFKRAAEYLLEYDAYFSGDIFDIGCGNGILTCLLARQHPDSQVTGLDISREAVCVAGKLAGEIGLQNVQFMCDAHKLQTCGTLFSCRTVHENVAWRPLCEENAAAALTAQEQEQRHRQYAGVLSALIKPQGYLVSVERYEDDGAYAGLVRALEGQGLLQVKGTHMQFSCRCGDGTGTFQTGIFRKIG